MGQLGTEALLMEGRVASLVLLRVGRVGWGHTAYNEEHCHMMVDAFQSVPCFLVALWLMLNVVLFHVSQENF